MLNDGQQYYLALFFFSSTIQGIMIYNVTKHGNVFWSRCFQKLFLLVNKKETVMCSLVSILEISNESLKKRL